MDKEIIDRGFMQTEAALARMAEAVTKYASTPDDLLRDAMIKRFEFSYELLWKLFRKIHILRGKSRHEVRAAYECIAEAGAAGWLKNRAMWEMMREDRNLTSHEYDMSAADDVAKRISTDYFPEMQRVLAFLKINYIDKTPFDKWVDRAETY
jgi:nucleotidyltransferase substrate binding protein (TIGR01987 family)